ncbi:MAG: sigma-70 family RNA polymerase sigma factor [Myxococcota bacterium]
MAIDVEDLYRRYGPMVKRRCRRLLGDDALAVDAMHDVFVELLRHEHRLESTAPASLLFTMATHVCLNRIRSKRRRPETPDDALLAEIAGTSDHEGQVWAARFLDRLFAREPESTRVIATLHLVDRMTHEEVAREVGMSVSGVRKRLRVFMERAQEGARS